MKFIYINALSLKTPLKYYESLFTELTGLKFGFKKSLSSLEHFFKKGVWAKSVKDQIKSKKVR